MTAPTIAPAGFDRRRLDDPTARPRAATPNAAAIAAACRAEVGHVERCLLCGHPSASATPAGLAILVDHHARTQARRPAVTRALAAAAVLAAALLSAPAPAAAATIGGAGPLTCHSVVLVNGRPTLVCPRRTAPATPVVRCHVVVLVGGRPVPYCGPRRAVAW